MTGSRPVRRVLGVLAVAWAAFAVLAAVLAAHHWLPYGFESAAVEWSVAHRPDGLRRAAVVVTSLGSGPVPYLLALTAGVLAARGRGWADGRGRTVAVALVPLLWLVCGQLLRQGLMHAFARPRPPLADQAARATGFAFPSGHAFTSTVSAGLLVLVVLRLRPSAARPAVAAAAVFAVAVGVSRVYLGVHWPLDVLGSWLLAAGWLAAASLWAVPRR